MTISDIYFEVQDRINKHNTAANQNISQRQFVRAFNMAQYFWFDQRVKHEEGTKILASELQSFTSSISGPPSYTNKYYFLDLPSDYYYYKRVEGEATKDDCTNTIYARIVEHSNISNMLRSDLDKPSFKWQDTIGVIAKDTVRMYHGDDFKLDTMALTYYSKPQEVDMTEVGGSNVTSVLSGSSLYEVINLCSLMLASDIKDVATVQTLRNFLNT